MARDMNPNKVTRREVDEVFIETAKEVIDKEAKRRPDKYLAKTQAERDRDIAKAQAIVDKANAKKNRGK